MPLHLHTAPRTDLLAEGLAGVLAGPADDPFAEELVVVPAKGVERWLAQRLSHRLGRSAASDDGVCAGVRFLNPRSLVALLTGTEDEDPWDPDRMVWPLLDVIDDAWDEPWCAPLALHLGRGVEGELGELRRDRRWSVARRLAGLFASYAVQRPGVLTDWRAGRHTDGAGARLAADLAWQPPLWRALTGRVGVTPPDVRHQETVDAIRSGRSLPLPSRLSMFGHTRLPVTELELLRALAETREVHMWLPQASPAAWAELADVSAAGPVRRREDHSARLLHHPLLASLGRDSRELQRSLALLGPVTQVPAPDDDPAPGNLSLLGRLQQGLRADAVVPGDGPPERGDRSVQVHACHGPARQVEVLREVLVGLLEDDPTLEPRDILVMCPDIEAYAPLFSATFGLPDALGDHGHPGHRLRVRLADRGLAATNPLLALGATLVRLSGSRATASEVLDLASSPPVRHRFELDDEQLAEIAGWVDRAGIRWGLSPELRAPYGLERFEENTWRTGLDRVLLGVAAAEGDVLLGNRLPLDDIGSASIDLAGRLSELVDRLEQAVLALRAARTVDDWVTALRAGVRSLGSVPRHDAWQSAQFEREIDSLAAEAVAGGHGPAYAGELRLADVRTLLDQRLRPRPTRANFRTGHLTVCTMVPMRSVPHRVICLVGLDDGVFPRSTVADGDDVLQRAPMTGERDLRSEDRQLLLDAVLAAQETLVVTYTGATVTTNQERPPAVPLDELLDALEVLAPGARQHTVRHHPLQPFDPRCFDAAEPFSFDARYAEAAQTVQGERRRPAPFLHRPLDPGSARSADVALADLQGFFRHPVRGFLRQGLDVASPEERDEPADTMPLTLAGLDAWEIGDRILRRVIEEADPQAVLDAELRRGDLPPRGLGAHAVANVCTRVQELAAASAADREAPPTTMDVTVDLGDGRRLTGVVPDVRGDRLVRVTYSRLAPKHRIAAWIDLLALTAAFPDRSWTAATYGWFKRYGKEGVASSLLGPVDDRAVALLRELVEVRDRGLCEPLPLFTASSAAWATAVGRGDDGLDKALYSWRGSDLVPGERDDPAHVRVFGAGVELDRVVGQPRDDEDWNDEPTRAGRYALRVWAPLLAGEKGRNL